MLNVCWRAGPTLRRFGRAAFSRGGGDSPRGRKDRRTRTNRPTTTTDNFIDETTATTAARRGWARAAVTGRNRPVRVAGARGPVRY